MAPSYRHGLAGALPNLGRALLATLGVLGCASAPGSATSPTTTVAGPAVGVEESCPVAGRLFAAARAKRSAGELRRAAWALEAAVRACPLDAAGSEPLSTEIHQELERVRNELSAPLGPEAATDARSLAGLLGETDGGGAPTAERRRRFDRALFALEQRTGDRLRVRSRAPDGLDAWFWSPDGRYLVTYSQTLDGQPASFVYEAGATEPSFVAPGVAPWIAPSFSADSRFMLTTSWPSSLLELATGRLTRFEEGAATELSPDARTLLVTRERSIELLSLPDLRRVAIREDLPAIGAARFAPDGRTLGFTSHAYGESALVVDAATLKTLFGPVEGKATFRADLRQVALLDPDKGVWVVRELPTGNVVRRVSVSTSNLVQLQTSAPPVWSSDGRLLAVVSGTEPTAITLVELASGRASFWHAEPQDELWARAYRLEFAEGGARICASDVDREVRWCSLAVGPSGELRPVPPKPGRRVLPVDLRASQGPRLFEVPTAIMGDGYTSFAIDADARTFALLRGDDAGAGWQARLELYDLGSWQLERAIPLPWGEGMFNQAVTFSPRNDTVTATYGGKRHVLERATGRTVGVLDMDLGLDPNIVYLLPAAYRPDGGAVASGTGWLDTRSGKMTRLVPDPLRNAKPLLPTASSDRLLLVGRSGTAYAIRPDLSGGAPLPIALAGAPELASVAFSGNGSRLVLADGKRVRLFDLSPMRQLWSVTGVDVRSVALAEAGTALAWGESTVGMSKARVHVVTMAKHASTSPSEKIVETAAERVSALRFDARGSRLAWVSGGFVERAGRLSVAELPSATIRWTADTAGSVAFSPDGSLLASGWMLFDPATGKPLRPLRPTRADAEVSSLSFSADGRRLCAIAGMNLGVWLVATGEPAWKRELDVDACAFDRNGKAIVVTKGTMLRVLDAFTGDERLRIQYVSESSARADTPEGLFEEFGTSSRADTLCTLGARVLPFTVCDAALRGVKGLWPWALRGDVAAISP